MRPFLNVNTERIYLGHFTNNLMNDRYIWTVLYSLGQLKLHGNKIVFFHVKVCLYRTTVYCLF